MFRRNQDARPAEALHLRLSADDHSFPGDGGRAVDVEGYAVESEPGVRLPRDDGECVRPGLCHFKIAGLTHHGVAALGLAPLKQVELIPDPSNRFDPNAIEIRVDGKIVGYVPRALAGAIHGQLRKDAAGMVTRCYRIEGECVAAEVIVAVQGSVTIDVYG